ncbi:hypothetical protein CIB93_05945 [Streptomyces sp. WZ.A104]|uniref:hypothetical protein n=1 Tax=Streptomyces sp. WZ.A104 TaxID=2023771 RepID=UPI000BBCE255|nr:hypothetical protein [Streptomyces sp. WZ.A104]PCG87073.1 hypothetical protein CIB93_05945 [Streptomyces sp. WZ.A104]
MRKLRVLLPVVGVLAGCGVGPAGPDSLAATAPTVTVSPRLYWVTADGKLRGVAPIGKAPATTTTEYFVRQLLSGPSQALVLEGLSSELPEFPEDEDVPITVTAPVQGPVTVMLPPGLSRLDRTAVGQVTCTVWSAEAARRGSLAQVEVVLSSGGRRSGPHRCADFPTVAGPST